MLRPANVCAGCGTENPPWIRYCQQCGGELGIASPPRRQTDSKSRLAIASLVAGIVGVVTFFIPGCAILAAMIGILLGIIGMQSPTRRALAIWGLVLSGISIVLGMLVLVAKQ